MKKIITAIAILFCLSASAQKKDTTLVTTFTLQEYNSLLYTISQLIDSKKATQDIVDFLNKRTQMIKPKESK